MLNVAAGLKNVSAAKRVRGSILLPRPHRIYYPDVHVVEDVAFLKARKLAEG